MLPRVQGELDGGRDCKLVAGGDTCWSGALPRLDSDSGEADVCVIK